LLLPVSESISNYLLCDPNTSFIFNKRKFDYCIVDEASQLTLPVCLGPLRYADRFVLVGDHFQLPPLVRNVEAQKGGLDVSLFKLLTESHPTGLTVLEHQYRMNEDIMLLSNSLVYDGMLKCGNEIVAMRVLQIPYQNHLDTARPWIKDVLSDKYVHYRFSLIKIQSCILRYGSIAGARIEARRSNYK
jgi:superfamily I DNA and/or RNA helicase